MKHLAVLLILTLFFTLSCNKGNDATIAPAPAPKTFATMTDSEKLVAFASDPDVKNILTIQLETTEKLVRSGIDLGSFDFSNQEKLLVILGYTKEQYLAKINSVRASALAFTARYAIPKSATTCQTCSMSEQEKFAGLGKLLAGFQKDNQSFLNFKSAVINKATPLLIANPALNQSNAGCGFWFYVCVGLCASTVEALPVYLICCAYCLHSECTVN